MIFTPQPRPKHGHINDLRRVYKPHDLIAYTNRNREDVFPEFAIIRQIEAQIEMRGKDEVSMPTKLDAWPVSHDFVDDPEYDATHFRNTITVNPNNVIGRTTPECAMHAMAMHARITQNVHVVEKNRIKMRALHKPASLDDMMIPSHLETKPFAVRYATELSASIRSMGSSLRLTSEDENAARLLAHSLLHCGVYNGFDNYRSDVQRILSDLLS